MEDLGVDPPGLGRWSWYLLKRSKRVKTSVIPAYAPCGSAASKKETYWQQQVRYVTKKGLKTHPKGMFRKDILQQLR